METSNNVLIDKWEFNGISTIKTPYQQFTIKPFAKDGKDMGKLIVTAVNACKAINQANPLKVAEVLPDIFDALKYALERIKDFDKKGDEYVEGILKQATE